MPTITEHEEQVARDEKKNKEKPRPEKPSEIEPVTMDDLNERTERARREGDSGE